MFLWLIHRPHRIIHERRRALFDVTPEYVRYRPPRSELDQPSRARQIRRKIADVETTRIQMIAGEQRAGLAVVIRDVCRLMTRNREHVNHAVPQIDRPWI